MDLNMKYYLIRLNNNVINSCKIILPWGKYSYKQLNFGVRKSLKHFQDNMNEIFQDI